MTESSSRIFIRNLPPSLNESSFRSHFSGPNASSLTDFRYFPKRRIGYVGYKSCEDAHKAVKYFDRSFIGMARIRVEIAKPYIDSTPKPTEFENIKQSFTSAASLKRKRDNHEINSDTERSNKDSKLNEFLQVMTSTTGQETYQDDEVKKAKLKNDDNDNDDDKEISDNNHKSVNDNDDENKTRLDQTDDAWLKSKTSNLLPDDEDNGNNDDDSKAQDDVQVKAESQDESREESREENKVGNAPSTEEKITKTGRLFIRNLSFDTTESDLREYFSEYGSIALVDIPRDRISGKSKGYAFVSFDRSNGALKAYNELDGKSFQGRLIHIIAAEEKTNKQLDEFAISQLPLKQQQKLRRKMEGSNFTHKWNPLYMNMDDVVSSISSRLGISKSEILDPTSSDSAVRQALVETRTIQETKTYFLNHGVDLDSFKPGNERGDSTILVKNFPFGTKDDGIRDLFEPFGKIRRLLIPPSGIMALIEFDNASQGRSAFEGLKYKRLKNSILFLEKAPKEVFNSSAPTGITMKQQQENVISSKLNAKDLLEDVRPAEISDTSTLFIRNLNFTTTSEKLQSTFSNLSGFISALVKTKPNPKQSGEILSMGFGFMEFTSKEEATSAMAAMNDYILEGHKLQVQPSQKVLDTKTGTRIGAAKAAAKVMGQSGHSPSTKIVVKNVPFEASKSDIRNLLGAYGRLRSVRLPKKFDAKSRGFAFAEFASSRDASAAVEALRNTHLLGRRLHLEFATEEAVDAEEEIERMTRKVGQQVDKVALKKLVDSSRHKLNIDEDEESE